VKAKSGDATPKDFQLTVRFRNGHKLSQRRKGGNAVTARRLVDVRHRANAFGSYFSASSGQ
jgi:hypothetical protein